MRLGSVIRTSAALAVLSLAATACSADPAPVAEGGSGGDGGTVDLTGIQLASAALTRFDDCGSLSEHLQTEAKARVTAFGLPNAGGFGGPATLDFALEESVTADGAAAPQALGATGGGAAPADRQFSGTNVQEAGVDEADIVKTNGEIVVAIARNRLWVVSVEGADVLGSLELPGGQYELFLGDGRALVVGTSWDSFEPVPLGEPTPAGDVAFSPGTEPAFGGAAGSNVLAVDLSDPSDPTIDARLDVEGRYLSARQIGDTVRVALTSHPGDIGFVFPADGGPAATRSAETANREAVDQTEALDWLPQYRLKSGGEETEGTLTECSAVHEPPVFSGFGTLSILTFGIEDDLGDGDAVSVLAGGETVYASDQSLYVATNRWVDPAVIEEQAQDPSVVPDGDFTTEIHRFDIGGSDPAVHVASGSVRGHLLNQFSLSEHEGFLRVATTDGFPWQEGPQQSESFVTVLRTDGDELGQVGQVGELGRGESIFAVRYLGDMAYVVTFRQTDPLYVVDLGDPEKPTVEGELKILGYSAYLHPIDDTTLIGVGQDADEDGRTQGTQVSLFDVSDPTDPRRISQLTLAESSSNAEYDHRAFLWWAPESLGVIPVQEFGERFESGALAFRARSGSLESAGRITQETDVAPGQGRDGTGIPEEDFVVEEFGHAIVRTFVIGDQLWTLSEAGLQANDLRTLDVEAEIPFA